MSVSGPTAISGTDSRFSSEAAGYLLGKPGIAVMVILLIIAAWSGHIPIAIALGLLVAAAGLSRLWSRLSLKGVTCERVLSQRRVFPGEEVELRLKLTNRKLLPLPWVQVDDQVPLGFSPAARPEPGSRPGFGALGRSASVLWYSALSWRLPLRCAKRGYYRLGPLAVTSGDIFGFYPRTLTAPGAEFLTVYPRIFPVTRLMIPSVYPVGEARSERRIFEDATRTTGIRDYQPRDSLRRIHWKASARHGRLQSRLYEPTTTLKVVIFLAVDSFPNSSPADEERFELGISTAASIASYLVEQDSPIGLYVNTRQADSAQPVAIPPGSGVNHLAAVLEGLARTTSLASAPFDDFLREERPALHWGTTAIFIFANPPPELASHLAALAGSGYKALAMQIGGAEGSGNGTCWQHITSGEQLAALGMQEAA